jgi:membrane protein insertase Oxa1/YidC/SpoIIIJ
MDDSAQAPVTHRTALLRSMQLKVSTIYKENNCSPFAAFAGVMFTAPVFMTFFFGLRSLVEKAPDLVTSTFLWLPSLDSPDPYYVLPVLNAAFIIGSMMLNAEAGGNSAKELSNMHKFFGAMTVLLIPVASQFKSILLIYWITSNIFAVFQSLLLKVKGVRSFFNIPTITKEAREAGVFPFDRDAVAKLNAKVQNPSTQSIKILPPKNKK